MKTFLLTVGLTLFLSQPVSSQEKNQQRNDRQKPAQQQQQRASRRYPPKMPGAKVEVYKTVGEVKLNMYIYHPKDHKASDKRPAIVFFFGGGWRSGTPTQFLSHCQHLASRGMVAMAADYRVASRHRVKAVSCVSDAKSAIRWIRQHAAKLGVDPDRIAAAGGSAGGHLAACTATLQEFDESNEDQSISSRPAAMVLFNPAVVLAPVEGQPSPRRRIENLASRLGVEAEKLSPYHHVKKGAPPTLIFHGTADKTVPYATVELFTQAMTKAGNQCKLIGYEGQGHGFFNHGRGKAYGQTLEEMDDFLVQLGYFE